MMKALGSPSIVSDKADLARLAHLICNDHGGSWRGRRLDGAARTRVRLRSNSRHNSFIRDIRALPSPPKEVAVNRFSVATLMGLVLVSAIGLVALRDANELWAGVMCMITFGLLGTALLSVVYLRDREQARWLGFLIFAGSYLLISLGPWAVGSTERYLVTAQALRYVHTKVALPSSVLVSRIQQLQSIRGKLADRLRETQRRVRNTNDPALSRIKSSLSVIDAEIKAMRATVSPSSEARRWRSAFPGAADHEHFRRVAHCLFALLAGLVGALMATRVYGKRVRAAG